MVFPPEFSYIIYRLAKWFISQAQMSMLLNRLQKSSRPAVFLLLLLLMPRQSPVSVLRFHRSRFRQKRLHSLPPLKEDTPAAVFFHQDILFTQCRKQWRPVILEGQQRGVFREGDHHALCVAIFGAIQGIAQEKVRIPDTPLPKTDWLMDMIVSRAQ